MIKRIAMWACPRTVSTALLRSFCQHSEVFGVDEPFYAYYLNRSGKAHPMRDEVIASQSTDFQSVADEVLLAQQEKPIQYVKHMSHHLFGDEDFRFLDCENMTHAFLIRHPREMLPSLKKDLGNLEVVDIGYRQQVQLFEALRAAGHNPVVIDSTAFLEDPSVMLPKLCHALGISFEERMMAWPKGNHLSYGVWAPVWYEKVMSSTGWRPYTPKIEPFPQELLPLLEEEALPAYEKLLEYSL